MFIIDTCSSLEECNELEIFWIAYFKSIGCRLTNVTIGGGGANGMKQSPEAIAKRMAKCIGQKRSEETKKKLSESARNRGPEFKEKMRKIAMERTNNSIQKAVLAASEKYKKLSQEEKDNRYKKRTEKVRRDGTCYPSPEQREKLSKAMYRRWEKAKQNGKNKL